MSNIKREYYEVDGAAKILDVSLSDIWHLIEVGRVQASFRRIMADSHISMNDDVTIDDYIAVLHTF